MYTTVPRTNVVGKALKEERSQQRTVACMVVSGRPQLTAHVAEQLRRRLVSEFLMTQKGLQTAAARLGEPLA